MLALGPDQTCPHGKGLPGACTTQGIKVGFGVQDLPLLQRSREVPKWHPLQELVGPLWPGLLDRNSHTKL